MTDVVTIGESMVLFQPLQGESLRYAPLFTRSIAGAESNVAIGLTRLGKKVRWIGRVGDDPFGEIVVSTLAGEGVDISCVRRDNIAPTGVYFKESKINGIDPTVYYYRKGSAASRLSLEDMSDEWFVNARHLHVTGITPALGKSAYETILQTMITAREKGLSISYDPNLRRKLWSEEEARKKLNELILYCDYFLPGIEEAEFLLGTKNLQQLGEEFLSMGPKLVIIKLGVDGSIAFTDKNTVKVSGFKVPNVVDTVGAGDAFAVGILSFLLDHHEQLQADSLNLEPEFLSQLLKMGNALGAFAVQYRGDWEGLPTRLELNRLLTGEADVTR